MAINTMEHLRLLGVDVGYWDYYDRDYGCDILHIFGVHYWQYHRVMLAKSKKIKIALSTICYTPSQSLPYRLWKYIDPIIPVDTTYRLNRDLIAIADILLPNSVAESDYLVKNHGAKAARICVIPNAADTRFAKATADLFFGRYSIKDFVLCVGKIEPRKNQLNLVKALANTNKELVIIGDPIPNRMDYFRSVIDIVSANRNMLYLSSLPHDSDLLSSAYAASRVHVLLGKNETPGIVNLEAGLAGANLVVAECPPVREYLGDYAEYCNHDSLSDIRRAIDTAFNKPRSKLLREFILQNYTWDIAARKTLDAYNSIK